MQIEKIKVCEPIVALIKKLEEIDYEITQQKVSDYHFHEVFIKMAGNNLIQDIIIENIERHNKRTFFCKCHWSTVEIDDYE